jgi:hypothetical protein
LRDQAGAKLQRSSPPEKGNFFKSFSEVKVQMMCLQAKAKPKKLQRKKQGRWRKFRKRQQRERRSVAGTKRTVTRRERKIEDP